MRKTLIVDDEKLVRNEMRNLVDWEKYGIEIVGEAENGRNALKILASQEVDLMFTDLTMPGLSGIEFLQVVRDRYPDIQIVVMTIHQNFEYVQQAMRLGVLDYITKTRIEKENFGVILEGILKRISTQPVTSTFAHSSESFLYRVEEEGEDPTWGKKLDDGIWKIKTDEASDIPAGFVRIDAEGMNGLHYRDGVTFLRNYVDRELFYLYIPGKRKWSCTYHQFYNASDKWEILGAEMEGTDWILDNDRFESVCEQITQMQLNKEELMVFLYQPFLKCANYLGIAVDEYFSETEKMRWWFQWKEWLDQLRMQTAVFLRPNNDPQRVLMCAVKYVNTHYMQNLDLASMLQMTAMGKSSFCAGFKELTGKSFVGYLKFVRVEQAKKLLNETKYSVQDIAIRVGYDDERYFRRVFTEITGQSPARFRKDVQD